MCFILLWQKRMRPSFHRSGGHPLYEVLGHEKVEDQHGQDSYRKSGEEQAPIRRVLAEEGAQTHRKGLLQIRLQKNKWKEKIVPYRYRVVYRH